jgi:hypothetical protein
MTQTLTSDVVDSWRRSLARLDVGLDLTHPEDRADFRREVAAMANRTTVGTLRALVRALGDALPPADRAGVTRRVADLWIRLRAKSDRVCDHCDRAAVWEVDVFAYDGDMLERLRYCDVRMRERWAEQPSSIAAARRFGTAPLYVIGAGE